MAGQGTKVASALRGCADSSRFRWKLRLGYGFACDLPGAILLCVGCYFAGNGFFPAKFAHFAPFVTIRVTALAWRIEAENLIGRERHIFSCSRMDDRRPVLVGNALAPPL